MKHVLKGVAPIRPGYRFELRLRFQSEAWEAERLAFGQLIAQFRSSVPGPVLFEADTYDGTIAREEDRTLAIKLDELATLPMGLSSIVVFDFARIEAGEKFAINGRVTWPVLWTVTRNV